MGGLVEAVEPEVTGLEWDDRALLHAAEEVRQVEAEARVGREVEVGHGAELGVEDGEPLRGLVDDADERALHAREQRVVVRGHRGHLAGAGGDEAEAGAV
jgi:hypothetical protein